MVCEAKEVEEMNFRHALWHLGIGVDKCPYCRRKLAVHGFFPNERYSCPDGKCRFNEVR